MRLEEKIATSLNDQKKTLSIAESCSGGQLCDRLTNVPGSSNFLKLGIVTYSNEAKTALLNIPKSLLKKHGAVSEPVAIAMAKNVRKKLQTDLGISITGIAGPTGGSAHKPVGLTFISLNSNLESICFKCLFKGTRISIKKQASSFALNLLNEFLT